MGLKSALLKHADSIIGPLLCASLRHAQQKVEYRHLEELDAGPILVIRPGGIGDAIMLLPMLKVLREQCPSREIDILCESRNAEIFSIATPTSKVYTYDKAPFQTLRMLRKRKYAAVIDSEQFHNLSGVMAAITRAPMRIGYKINTNRLGLYTHLVSYDLDGPEDIQFGRLLSAALGRDIQLPAKFKLLAPLFQKQASCNGKKRILIHVGGSVEAKRWPIEKYAYLCRELVREHQELELMLLGGKEDITAAKMLSKACKDIPLINKCGYLSLYDVATEMTHSTLLIGPDSGLAHLAAAAGLKAVVLFGPSDSRKWGPHPDCGIVVKQELPCQPCSIFGCVKPCTNCDCINTLPVDKVLEATNMLLSQI